MSLVTICKSFDFDAAHFLPNVPDGHKCKRLHGHTYRVEIRCEGHPTSVEGWFMDYADIAAAWAAVHGMIDHRCLNEVPGLENPTTEVLIAWMLKALNGDQRVAPFLTSIRIYESATTWCELTQQGLNHSGTGSP